MKSNFKINDIDKSLDGDNSSDSVLLDNPNDLDFDDVINSLPKGWNLWSIRNSSNKL
jgi:hypothetical protein